MRISDWSSDVCSSDLKIERHDGDVFARDILPDVEFGPVADRKDADALPLRFTGVVQVPQFGPLLLRVPAVGRGAEREDAFLGAVFFLVTASAANGDVQAVEVECVLQPFGMPLAGVQCAMVERSAR